MITKVNHSKVAIFIRIFEQINKELNIKLQNCLDDKAIQQMFDQQNIQDIRQNFNQNTIQTIKFINAHKQNYSSMTIKSNVKNVMKTFFIVYSTVLHQFHTNISKNHTNLNNLFSNLDQDNTKTFYLDFCHMFINLFDTAFTKGFRKILTFFSFMLKFWIRCNYLPEQTIQTIKRSIKIKLNIQINTLQLSHQILCIKIAYMIKNESISTKQAQKLYHEQKQQQKSLISLKKRQNQEQKQKIEQPISPKKKIKLNQKIRFLNKNKSRIIRKPNIIVQQQVTQNHDQSQSQYEYFMLDNEKSVVNIQFTEQKAINCKQQSQYQIFSQETNQNQQKQRHYPPKTKNNQMIFTQKHIKKQPQPQMSQTSCCLTLKQKILCQIRKKISEKWLQKTNIKKPVIQKFE